MAPGNGYKRSWGEGDAYLNDEHARIYKETESLPGWQDIRDSEKLYEMAFHNGGIILEIGMFGGRSATVELRGALAGIAAKHGPELPQFYGVDIDGPSVGRTYETLKVQKLAEHALLFRGGFLEFHRMIPITPTMVFVDGDHRYPGVWADLHNLSRILTPGTPVLCHDFGGIDGVRRAVEEWVGKGFYRAMGQFGPSALLMATARCGGEGPVGLPAEIFQQMRERLVSVFLNETGGAAETVDQARLAEVTEPARAICQRVRRDGWHTSKSGWPYSSNEAISRYPETLPDGRPWPKISIVTPSYNYGAFIEETILSVINQGYPNVEHIVIDGGSPDNTRDVIEKYRHALAYAVSEKDRGQSDAINKGFAKATGEILTWINADDMLAPGALHAMALAFWKTGADMVAGICEQYREGRLVEKHMTSCGDGELPAEELLDLEGRWMAGQFFMQPEVMFTRELWEKAGGHVDVDLHYSMDYELWLRFALAKARLHVMGRSVCWFRHHGEQKTSAVEKFLPELTRVRDEFAAKHGLNVRPIGRKVTRGALRVASVSDLGFKYGAGIGQRRLVNALIAGGHEVISFAASERVHSEVAADAAKVVEAVGHVSPDVVMVGNTHGASLSPELVGMLAKQWPTAVVLHDLWHLTGRCAYTGGCQKYLDGCDESCPTATQYPVLAPEKIRGAWEKKYEAYTQGTPPLFLANSEWTADIARNALKAQKSSAGVSTICFGIELDVFRPMDKQFCRRMLGLPEEGFVILSSASTVTDPRKGVHLLSEALNRLELPDVTVACVGSASPELERLIPGVRALGYTNDPQRLAMAYAAADLFVGPSTEEAFGQVFTEAAACGTPSVAFAVGGVSEAVIDNVNGRLAGAVNAESLSHAIFALYSDARARREMSVWGRLHAENEWSVENAYHELHVGLERGGFLAKLGIGPKVRFGPTADVAVEPVTLGLAAGEWAAVSGFDPWEGPYAEQKLPRCRWMLGPVSKVRVNVTRPGIHHLRLVCTAYHPMAALRVVHRGVKIVESAVTSHEVAPEGFVVSCNLDLRDSVEEIELHHWPWAMTESGRQFSVLLYDLMILDSHGARMDRTEGELPANELVASGEATC